LTGSQNINHGPRRSSGVVGSRAFSKSSGTVPENPQGMEKYQLKQVIYTQRRQGLTESVGERFKHFNVIHAKLGSNQQCGGELFLGGLFHIKKLFPVTGIHLFDSRTAINGIIDFTHRQSSEVSTGCERTHSGVINNKE